MNNMTQQEFAEIADISVGFLCDLESGKKWGTLDTMAKIATALKIKPYQLLMPEEDKNTDVFLHEDLAELSQYLKSVIDLKVSDLIKKYSQ